MLTAVGFRVSVPVLSLLFSDGLIAVTVSVTWDPAGMTTRPELSFTSLESVAVTVSPTLFLLELTSEVVAAVSREPAARLAAAAAGAAAEGLGDGAGAEALGGRGVAAAGRLGRVGVRAAGAGVAVVSGRSFSVAVVSTGASCRSRLRLSAVAVSRLSDRPQAATAANVSAAIIVLDICASLDVTCSGHAARVTFQVFYA